MAVDLEALYEQTKKQGLIEAPETTSKKVDLEALYQKTKKVGLIDNQQSVNPVENPSLLKEFGKANEQVTGGVRNFIQSGFQPGSLEAGFKDPSKAEKFADRYPQQLMNLLESTSLRNHPNIEAQAFYAGGIPLKAAGLVADAFTNPLDIAGGIVGGRLMQGGFKLLGAAEDIGQKGLSRIDALLQDTRNMLSRRSALPSSKAIPKYARAEGVFGERAAQIESRAENAIKAETNTLSYEKEALSQQIENTKNLIRESGKNRIAQESVSADLSYGQQLIETTDKINSIKKGIPFAAQKDAQKINSEIPKWMNSASSRWNKEIDAALSGPEADIFVNPDSLVEELTGVLKSRGIDIEDGVALSANQTLTPGEIKVVNLIKRIESSPSAVSVRQLLRDVNEMGKGVKYGKVFSPDMALLDDAKSVLASQAEDIIPSIKNTKAWYSEYAQLRNRAFKSLDPLGGKYSTKATSFFEKLAKGEARPEDYQFLDDLERSVGKKAGREADGLSKEQAFLEKFKDDLSSMKTDRINRVQASIDAEIDRLNEVLKKESVGLENRAGEKIKSISEKAKTQAEPYLQKANDARIRVAKLKRMKAVAKWALGLSVAGSTAAGAVSAVNK